MIIGITHRGWGMPASFYHLGMLSSGVLQHRFPEAHYFYELQWILTALMQFTIKKNQTYYCEEMNTMHETG